MSLPNSQLLTRKDEILKEAFFRFSEMGIVDTKVDDIAPALRMSKKTIYSIFRTKEDLLTEACAWKLSQIAAAAQQVVDMEISFVEKLIKYLEIVANDVTDISLKMSLEVLEEPGRIMEIVNEYLKTAVYGRFSKLLEQASSEDRLKEGADPAASLMMYWETLSSFLFSRPFRHIPEEFKTHKPIYEILGEQLINFFRGFLNEKGINEFDSLLKNHPHLPKVFKQ